jgi:hypothetical protein
VTSGAYGRNDSEPDIERYSYPRLAARLADEVRGLLDAEA